MKNVIFRLPATFLLTTIFIFTSGLLFSQNNAPIIVNDTIDVSIGEFITINPVLNDYDPDGDVFLPEFASFRNGSGTVVMVGSNFEIQINNYTYLNRDTIQYMIKDQYGELSLPGYVIVNIAPNMIRDTLDINNVSASFASWGEDYYTNNFMPKGYLVPKNSNKGTIFASSLWMAGHDSQNVIHSSSRLFDANLRDYVCGPSRNTICDRDSTYGYNRVWKITKAQIDYHLQNLSNSSYVVPDIIKYWPAHGNVSVGEAAMLAPFVDVNSDGNYNVQSGDYPDIKGDECILTITNDNVSRDGFNSTPLKVDIIQMIYAYNCPDDTALNHTIFMEYDIYNRSQNTYNDFLIGNFYDFDIGESYDDYNGCDTNRNLFFAYNSDNDDELNGYGINPPVQGVKILNQTMSSFNVFYNPPSGTVISQGPSTSDGLYNSLLGKFPDGTPITIGGNGLVGSVPTKYFYPGDVNDNTQWSEVSAANVNGDIRAIGSIGPFNFAPNQKISLDVALIYTRGDGKNNFENIDLLKQHSDHIQDVYDEIITPCIPPVGINNSENTPEIGFNIYPNPTSGDININSNIEFHNADYKIYSMIGQYVSNGILKNNTESISVSNLQTGIYFLSITDGERTYSQKFVVK